MGKSDDKKPDQDSEIDEFLSQFDGEENNKKSYESSHEDMKTVHRSRTKKKKTKEIVKKNTNPESPISNDETSLSIFGKMKLFLKNKFLIKNIANNEGNDVNNMKNGATKNKKYKLNKKQFFKFILFIFLTLAVVIIAYASVVIATAPKINPDDIYSTLSESSTIYDDSGAVIDNVSAGENRTNIDYKVLPENLKNAFIALEDKTFWKNHGFNFIRIFGALKDAIFTGSISGTSTITQQLARNIYLTDTMSTHSLKRKIQEAYYTVVLEKKLTKQQILEAYLNTINLGNGAYGVQAAAQSYFSKDVQDLSLAQCAALAALPQAPTAYALIKFVSNDSISEKDTTILSRSSSGTYVYNDISKERRDTCLYLMNQQGMISDSKYKAAKAIKLADMLKPSFNSASSKSSFFTDYVIDQVIADLMTEYKIDYEDASNKVYKQGLKIYTTMDSQAQSIVEKEFENASNFPSVVNIKKNSKGDIVNSNGNVMLYAYSNYFNSKDVFTFKTSEYKKNSDGSLTIKSGKRLAIYKTTVNRETNYSIEFKDLYRVINGKFYSISGGYVNIPGEYKSKNSDGDLVISADFFTDYPTFFTDKNGTLSLTSSSYTLSQKVIQPQAAMVISDISTGQVKAMIGGRDITGRRVLNRAIGTRQPGSSIKPLAVYSAALQKSYDALQNKQKLTYTKIGAQGTSLYGDYLTAASIIDDEPTTINGRVWPKNSYNSWRGLMTMRKALQQSVNVCAVKIFMQVGADYSSKLVEKYGITSLVKTGGVNDMNAAALALGGMSQGVSPLEMSTAYATFVNGGKKNDSSVYTKVENQKGEVILKKTSKSTKVLDKGVAFIMTDLLKSVVSGGIGSPASISGVQAGGKTGTTTNQFDIWFDGFTPTYSASLWIGNDVNIALSSSSYSAAVLWGKIMNQVKAAKKGTYLSAPSDVIRAKAYSVGSATEYFISGTQRSKKDSVYSTVTICKDSGELATPLCTSTTKKSGILRPYTPNSRVGDISKELPQYYCNLHNTDILTYPIDPKKKLIPYVPPVVTPPVVTPPVVTPPVVTPPNKDVKKN